MRSVRHIARSTTRRQRWSGPDCDYFNHAIVAVQMRQEHPVLLDTLLRLFAQRPAWLLPALLEHSDIKATDTKPAAVETAIALLSYRFLGGPWRPALICRGCDPRKETRFWRYQVLSCTLPDHWKGSAAHQKLDALAGCRQSPWRASADIDDAPPAHTIASQYGELVKLDSIPVTKVSYYQVRRGLLVHVAESFATCTALAGHAESEAAHSRRCALPWGRASMISRGSSASLLRATRANTVLLLAGLRCQGQGAAGRAVRAHESGDRG